MLHESYATSWSIWPTGPLLPQQQGQKLTLVRNTWIRSAASGWTIRSRSKSLAGIFCKIHKFYPWKSTSCAICFPRIGPKRQNAVMHVDSVLPKPDGQLSWLHLFQFCCYRSLLIQGTLVGVLNCRFTKPHLHGYI